MDKRTQQMLLVGGVVGAGLLLWMLTKSRTASAGMLPLRGSSSAGSPAMQSFTLPAGVYSSGGALYQSALAAPTASQVSSQSSLWANLVPTSAPVSSGYVNFPSGSQAAAVLLPWRTDGAGNFYVTWAGTVYAVGLTPDQYGNYTAIAQQV